VLRNAEGFSTTEVLLWVGIPLAILLIAAVAWPAKVPPDDEEDALDDELLAIGDLGETDSGGAEPAVVSEARGRYPVPPLDLKVPVPPIRAARAAERRMAVSTGAAALTGARTNELPGGSDVVS
jgi:NADH-quinone oxidoreductase subunit H